MTNSFNPAVLQSTDTAAVIRAIHAAFDREIARRGRRRWSAEESRRLAHLRQLSAEIAAHLGRRRR